jgi:hypothetical protein
MVADENSPLSGRSFNAGRVGDTVRRPRAADVWSRIDRPAVAVEALRWKARWFTAHGDLVR